MKTVKVGSRGSKLARIQTMSVLEQLSALFKDVHFELVIISSKGDLVQDKPLSEIGGSGLFTNEIEKSLIAKQIDFAVHSMKDLPANLAPELCLAPSPARADPMDALVLKDGISGLDRLDRGAKIGTGSPRRAAQLAALRPDLEIVPIRGNVDSRLAKVGQELDGVMLAAAGLIRAGYGDKISCTFSPEDVIPAPGQGVLALECRRGDEYILNMLAKLADAETLTAVIAERSFLRTTGAGCHAPVGAYCRVDGEEISILGLYGEEGSLEYVTGKITGKAENADRLGAELAEMLKNKYGEKYRR